MTDRHPLRRLADLDPLDMLVVAVVVQAVVVFVLALAVWLG